MHFSLKSCALATLLLLPNTYGSPTAIPYDSEAFNDISEAIGSPLDKRGCSSSNSGLHCRRGTIANINDANNALNDLLSQCDNGNLPANAKRVASDKYNGVVAYACNGFCRTGYMPCQDAEWSIRRVLNSCYNDGVGQPNQGWDSQETRGTWYGVTVNADEPCGYAYSGRGATY